MSRGCKQVAVFVVLTLAALAPAVADLSRAKVVHKSGNWTVLRTNDPMTDEAKCTGIYKGDYGIQLTPGALYIRVQGGIESVTLRFGDKPAQPLRLPSKMEKDVRVVILNGSEFAELQESDRLRYQVSTLVSGLRMGDLDLAGLPQALENIRAGCETPTAAPAAQSGRQGSGGAVASCAPAIVERMRQQGLTDAQIAAICR